MFANKRERKHTELKPTQKNWPIISLGNLIICRRKINEMEVADKSGQYVIEFLLDALPA